MHLGQIREAVAAGLPKGRRQHLRMEVLAHGAERYSINFWVDDWPLPAEAVAIYCDRVLSDYDVRPDQVAEARETIAASDKRFQGEGPVD